MLNTEPTVELDERFSEPGVSAPAWAEIAKMLTESEMFWLSTTRSDGRPHVAPLPAIWLDGTLYFCTGPHEQKSRNLASNPHCVLTAGNNQLRSGLDVVVEGTAARVDDSARLRRLAALWKSKLDWDFEATESGFRDPAERVEVVLVFGLAPAKVLAFAKGPYSQTRYRFTA